jgi:predicted NBD/HSP70 family sugar kinase
MGITAGEGSVGMSVSGLAPFDRRGHQRRVIVDLLRTVRTASRADIAATTGLSPQVITGLIDQLVEEGLVRVVGRRPAARGQPPIDLALNPDGGFAIGVQVEVGRLTGIVADLGANIRVEVTLRCRTADPATTLPNLRKLISELIDQSDIDPFRLWGLGLVLPGPFGPVDTNENDPLSLPAWSRVPFRDQFSAALSLPVFVGNDATAAAIGEHLNGIARDLRTFFYLYVSEGIGGGLFVEGQPVTGAFGNAGEVGRMLIGSAPGDSVPPALETLASVDALRRQIERNGHASARALDPDHLFAIDPAAAEDWLGSAARSLRVAIANLESLLDPEAIVIGGPLPERILCDLLARMEPLIPTVSRRGDRRVERVLLGRAGRISPALGGATLPLFHRLTPQPRPARPPRPDRLRARTMTTPDRAPARLLPAERSAS